MPPDRESPHRTLPPPGNAPRGVLLPQGIDAVARGGIAQSQAHLSPALRAVHQDLLRKFLATGRGPRVGWVRRVIWRHGLAPSSAIKALAQADLVHLNTGDERVEIAHPLSGLPSLHQVRVHGGRSLSAKGAIEALGIPLMADTAATILSAAPGTRQQIRVVRQHDGSWSWEPGTTVVVLATSECTGPIAGACQHTTFHAIAELGERYLSAAPREQGRVLTQDQALALAQAEFGPLLVSSGN
ncbi:organomercurial lyase [Streptomyces microflavus]|uniref:organomercurial lyase n=1 Tax=Streptomyces microflavus TaxID=1919 RepID=UPI003808692F